MNTALPDIESVVRKAADAMFGRKLVTNVVRGQLVEAIVACALEPSWTWCAADYASWDFERGDGIRAEIKQAASRQTWTIEGGPPSRPSFDIASRKGRWEGATWIAEPGRAAHLYIFAHHPVADLTADHRDVGQWQFHVVPAANLPPTQRLSLGALQRLAEPVGFAELAAAVESVAANIILPAAG